MLAHAFGPLGLHRVSLEVFAFNAWAIHVDEKVGFHHEGRMRDVLWWEGMPHDTLLTGSGSRVPHRGRFLLALGHGFCFVGRQQRLPIGDKDYYVDLVFYHRFPRAPILVDLKIGEIAPTNIAQMQLYLAWTRQHDHAEGEADPIGLILCGS